MLLRLVNDPQGRPHFAVFGAEVTYCGEPVAGERATWQPGAHFEPVGTFCASCAYINATWLDAGAWEGAGDPPTTRRTSRDW